MKRTLTDSVVFKRLFKGTGLILYCIAWYTGQVDGYLAWALLTLFVGIDVKIRKP